MCGRAAARDLVRRLELAPAALTGYRATLDEVKAAYAESVAYSLDAVTSFVQQLHDQELVLVVLGAHQPASIVAGQGASHDVPVSIIAADRAVMDRATDWGWQEGLRPDNGAPVWPMDAFRDRFLTTFGPQPSPTSSAHH